MDKKLQNQTPFLEALKTYLKEHNTSFDVPGHHQKGVDDGFSLIYGEKVYLSDFNAPRGLDNLANANGVIKQAEKLWADATGSKKARFLVNGSTSGILIMLLSCLKADEKIILPRNVHKSVINGLVLCGASPVFIMPEIDLSTEIVNQVSFEDWKKTIDQNLDAKAIFLINPTYFGATCDLKKIINYAHEKNMLVLVDEAHGTHFYFNDKFPITAIKAGADMATLSVHKTGGSLTQSSVLLINSDKIDDYNVNKAFNLITTTSPNMMFIASLDAARHYMVFKGKQRLDEVLKLYNYAFENINKIQGFKVRGKKHFQENGAFDFDCSKLVIEIEKIKLSGFEIYNLLKDKHNVQIELAETYVLLCILSIGTYKDDLDKLIFALSDISKKYFDDKITYQDNHYFQSFPKSYCRPRDAYHAPLKVVNYKEVLNCVSKDMVMIYPPGIPIIIPGEVFTVDVIKQIDYYKKNNAKILSDFGDDNVGVVDLEEWEKLKLTNF